jgi:class 3 adenylate cyclase
MKVTNSLINLTTRALAESIEVTMMETLANELFDNYDLHQRTGYPPAVPIPNRDAAKQIASDVAKAGVFHHFINLLILIHTIGWKGRKYPVSYLKQIIKEIHEVGFIYDHENQIFVEDPDVQRTRNWGALIEGEEYYMAFLRLDIVGNSRLVRKYPENVIQATYADLRKIVQAAIDKRNGRIWNWEGDGGMVAFYFSNKNLLAAMSGMEIINEVFIYNHLRCRLEEALEVRIAIHSGLTTYTRDQEELMKTDVIKETIQIEAKHTKPNSVTMSNTVSSQFDSALLGCLVSTQIAPRIKYCSYEVAMEN